MDDLLFARMLLILYRVVTWKPRPVCNSYVELICYLVKVGETFFFFNHETLPLLFFGGRKREEKYMCICMSVLPWSKKHGGQSRWSSWWRIVGCQVPMLPRCSLSTAAALASLCSKSPPSCPPHSFSPHWTEDFSTTKHFKIKLSCPRLNRLWAGRLRKIFSYKFCQLQNANWKFCFEGPLCMIRGVMYTFGEFLTSISFCFMSLRSCTILIWFGPNWISSCNLWIFCSSSFM